MFNIKKLLKIIIPAILAGVLVFFGTSQSTLPGPIKVGAFNIQIFGETKRNKPEVMEQLVKIAQEFDIMLVQEIRDAQEETADYYLEKINEDIGSDKYAFVKSEGVGRTNSKESYAYFYNTDKVNFITGSDYIYNDIRNVFEREPYIASFRSGDFDFTLAGIHTKPDDTNREIAHLEDVYNYILSQNPNEKDIIVMGDFNADGSYFDENTTTNPFKTINHYWVISNDMDTMTKTDWTYDRIVMKADTYFSEYSTNTASVFYFDQEYGITDQDLIEDISDHYPIYAIFETDLVDDD